MDKMIHECSSSAYEPMSPRPRVYKTEGIVLRSMDLGEADRVLTVLTPRLGKLRVIAKGVRRHAIAIGGGLEPFSDVQLVLAVGRTFDVVTSARSRTRTSGYAMTCTRPPRPGTSSSWRTDSARARPIRTRPSGCWPRRSQGSTPHPLR